MDGCTIVGNECTTYGGGVYCYNSSPTIANTIVAYSDFGSAVYCYDANSAPTLSCCDLYGNQGGDWSGCVGDQLSSTGNMSEDPMFCNFEDGDYSLREDSPCAEENSECGQVGAWPVGCQSTSVGDPHSALAAQLSPGVPNPFRSSTSISYSVPSNRGDAHVLLRIHDPAGRLIRTLVDGQRSSGTYSVSWDGRNEQGLEVTGGVYFQQLTMDHERQTRRLILVR